MPTQSNVAYEVVDIQTKAVLKTYATDKGSVARRFADKKSMEYGSYRYSAQIIWSDAQ